MRLISTTEPGRWQTFIETAAERITQYIDLDRLLTIAQNVDPLPIPHLSTILPPTSQTDHRPVIAVARDEAFNFTYEDNLDLLRSAGAGLLFLARCTTKGCPRQPQG